MVRASVDDKRIFYCIALPSGQRSAFGVADARCRAKTPRQQPPMNDRGDHILLLCRRGRQGPCMDPAALGVRRGISVATELRCLCLCKVEM
jgi:hypothetical protein